jgi:alkylation response protein AidB-like acyl-CoA dehydrogenase
MAWSHLSPEQLVQAAETLAPFIYAERAATERNRALSSDLFGAIRDAGLFSLWVPKDFGGPEIPIRDFMLVVEALARADASIAWCAANASTNSVLSGYLSGPIVREIWDNGQTVAAGALNSNRATAVAEPGGYRVTGIWSFASGISHSTWLLGGCRVFEGDQQRMRPDGLPDVRLVFFPKSEAHVLDTWDVSGLRGTGSHDFRAEGIFVPKDRSIDFVAPVPMHPGRIYNLPLATVFNSALMGAPLGVARACIDALTGFADSKIPVGSSQVLRDTPAVQGLIGRAEAMLRAARAFLLESSQAFWDTVETGGPTLHDRAVLRLAGSHAAATSVQVADMMFQAGGGTAIQESGRLARCWRDVHAMSHHTGIAPSQFEPAGRVMLGMDPGTLRL